MMIDRFLFKINHLSFVACTLLLVLLSTGGTARQYKCIKPFLEVGVAPASKKVLLIWRSENQEPGAWIGLYNKKPNMQNSQDGKIDECKVTSPSGWHKTKTNANINIDINNFTKQQNTGYFAVYWRKKNGRDEAVTTTRYDTYPDWMAHYWHLIQNKPISKIFIPGTHDSACHEKVELHGIKKLKKARSFQKLLNAGQQIVQSVPMVRELTITQDQTIKEQLAMGIRYLDIRVLRDGNEYWTAHSEYIMIKLEEVIKDVVEFVSKTEKEIVIFDIHQFISGFDNKIDDDDNKFVEFLKQKMTVGNKKWWVPRNGNARRNQVWQMKLTDIINTGGRIIVSYNNKQNEGAHHGGILWYPVLQYWGNVPVKIDDLKRFFDDKFTKRPEYGSTCTAAMAQLTPDVKSISGGLLQSIKKFDFQGLDNQAEANGKTINEWFMEAKFGKFTNILAVDYFRGMGTVRTAFLWNERTAQSDHTKFNCDPDPPEKDWYYQHNIIF